MKLIDLTGKRFGKLIVIGRDKEKEKQVKSKRPYWKCLCDCGNMTTVNRQMLVDGTITSCKRRTLKRGQSSFNFLFRNYKWGAEHRGLSFKLTKKQFKKLTKSNCYYCGLEPTSKILKADKGNSGNGKYIYNGIDRLNNEKGYTIENCVPCCKYCNSAKKEMTKKRLFAVGKKSI